jgi:hypothetical protein
MTAKRLMLKDRQNIVGHLSILKVQKVGVVVPKQWTIMSFAYTGSKAERNVRLAETRREVVGFDEDSLAIRGLTAKKYLGKVQELPSIFAVRFERGVPAPQTSEAC